MTFAAAYRNVSVDLRNGFADREGGDRLVSIENLIGSPYSDVLRGDDNANVIEGGGGEDTLYGYGGDDVLDGGDGVDVVDGGDGTDACTGEHSFNCEAASP
jgi:Ca2+-binding RTX toxin-like protein